MIIQRIDHFVMTVRDIDATCDFYTKVLGMDVAAFGTGRKALVFGTQKINLHAVGEEFDPKALRPTPGAVDVCFITENPLDRVMEELHSLGVIIEEGPVKRTGATGDMLSVYLRDPDGNLVEISNYL